MSTNLWQQFKDILPDSPRIYATITRIESGRVEVTTPSGGVLYALGSGVIGQTVWVQDNKVVGEAPTLQHYDIEV